VECELENCTPMGAKTLSCGRVDQKSDLSWLDHRDHRQQQRPDPDQHVWRIWL